MTVEEIERLRQRLEEVLGADEARTIMSEIGSRGVTREELREELLALEGRIDEKLGSLEAGMDHKLEILETRMDEKLARLEGRMIERINDQTKTFVRTFYVSNATMVLAVAGLAFGVARFA